MAWRDVILNKRVDKLTLKQVLLEVFQSSIEQSKIEIDEIKIIGDITEMADIEEHTRLVCEVSLCQNDEFMFMLSISILDEQLWTENDIEVVSKICSKLGCKALIEDVNELAPSIMFLVHPDGRYEHITVDPDALDGFPVEDSYFKG